MGNLDLQFYDLHKLHLFLLYLSDIIFTWDFPLSVGLRIPFLLMSGKLFDKEYIMTWVHFIFLINIPCNDELSLTRGGFGLVLDDVVYQFTRDVDV